jgi:hypothetical protein
MIRRRTLVAGVAGALLLAGGATGVALARSSSANAAPRLVQGKSLLVASAAYLGIPLRTLKGELHPGHPLAAIASSTPGRTVDGLRAAIYHDVAYKIGAGHEAVGGGRLRYIDGWLHRHIAAYVAGLCPLHMSALFIRLGGTCPGMSMRA